MNTQVPVPLNVAQEHGLLFPTFWLDTVIWQLWSLYLVSSAAREPLEEADVRAGDSEWMNVTGNAEIWDAFLVPPLSQEKQRPGVLPWVNDSLN